RCSPRRRSARSPCWPAVSLPSRGDGRCAVCCPAPGLPGCGRTTGRTGSSPGPAGIPMTWALPPRSWWWRFWSRPGCRSSWRSMTLCSGGGGRKVWAASWFHDGSAQGKHKTGRGNNWVVLAIVVSLPFCTRPFALPVMANLVVKGTSSASRLWLARRMTSSLADALPGRDLHAVADSAYAGEELKKLGKNVTWTTRLRKDAALHGLPPERTGKRGRPRVRGARLPKLAGLAAATAFTQVTVTRYGKTETVQTAAITCLWYTVFGTRPVQVVLVRDKSASGYDLALVTTDLNASPAQVIERYAARWSIEVAIEDAKQECGAGQARNRTPNAVRRTVPFQLACQAIAACWYATAGHDPADIEERRAAAPWYKTKTQPSPSDMTAKLRRVLIAPRFKPYRPDQPTPGEIHAIPLAWDTAAA